MDACTSFGWPCVTYCCSNVSSSNGVCDYLPLTVSQSQEGLLCDYRPLADSTQESLLCNPDSLPVSTVLLSSPESFMSTNWSTTVLLLYHLINYPQTCFGGEESWSDLSWPVLFKIRMISIANNTECVKQYKTEVKTT